jgi:prevent-host-death family protein
VLRDYNDHIVKSATIGIREAKAQLSRLVSEAERGAEWIITDRGRPVAKLTAVRDVTTPLEHRLARLESWGWFEPSRGRRGAVPPPIRIAADAQRALQEDRGA